MIRRDDRFVERAAKLDPPRLTPMLLALLSQGRHEDAQKLLRVADERERRIRDAAGRTT